MSSDIVLTAALRNNLLSLQNTQRLIDSTQLRLATGLKVNSALDNPSSFFTAQSLSNRASDLGRLLDGINLSLRTIEEADKGVVALGKLVEQANSIVSSARDELASSTNNARLVSTLDLSAVTSLADLGDGATVLGTERFEFITTDDAGNRITRTVVLGTTITGFAANITDTFADNENGEIKASVNENGNLVIESKGGRSFSILATDAATGTADINTGLELLGLGHAFSLQDRTFQNNNGSFETKNVQSTTVVAGNTVSTISLYEGNGDLIEAGDSVVNALGGTVLTDANGNTVYDGVASLNFAVDIDGTVTAIGAQVGTFQGFVDAINSNTTINGDVRAEFDSDTGQIRITKLTDNVRNVTITATTSANAAFVRLGLGDPTANLDPLYNSSQLDDTNTAQNIELGTGAQDFVISFNSSSAALDAFAEDYNAIRAQIDTLVEDANFRGVNLLNGDDLVTFFNESNTSSLTTEGENFTADGLGLLQATFRTGLEIETTAAQVLTAQSSVRSFGASLANSLAIIQTRRDFTESTITTLSAGAGDLTVADANEEGANLLALQTRQALGVTSLSLASQSQQSVLRLF